MTANSFFLGLFLTALTAVSKWWQASIARKLYVKSTKFLGILFSSSAVCRSFPHKEARQDPYEQSRVAKLLQKMISSAINSLRGTANVLEASLVGRFCPFICSKLEYVIGFCFFVFLVIPNNIWNNFYGLIAALIVLLLFIYKCATDKKTDYSFSRLDPSFLIFTLCLGFAVINAYDIADSLRVFATDLVPLIFVFITVNLIKTSKQLDVIIYSLLAGITVLSVYGIIQYAIGIPVDLTQIDVVASGYVPRVYSTMGNPNNLGEILVLFLPLFAYAIKRCKNWNGKLAVTVLAFLPLVNLALSLSRSSWIGFAASIVLFVLIIKPSLVPVLLIVAVLCIPIMPDFIISRLLTINKDSSSAYRYTIWQSSAYLLRDNPIAWLTGIGLGPAPFAYCIEGYMFDSPAHSHMLPLEILIELGIAGLTSFLWLAIRFIRKTVAIKDNSRFLAAAVLCGIGACVVVGFFEYIWFYPRVMWFFFIAIGLLMCITRPDFEHNN